MNEILNRRSVRVYDRERPVEEDKLNRIFEAARMAPTARGDQPFKIIVVRSFEIKQKLSIAAKNQMFIAEAPVVLAIVATNTKHIMSNGQPASSVNCSIVFDHISLQAVHENLSTCWVCGFIQEQAKEILKVPQEHSIVALMTLGYQSKNEIIEPREIKPMDQLICFEQWK